MTHHVYHCCANVIQGHCYTSVVQKGPSAILALILQGWWKHRDVQAGDGLWGRAPEVTVAVGQAPMKQASWGRAWVVKPQGLNNPGLE
jgi:hypothetical protein